MPIVVAVTKVDREDADPTRVRQQLAEHELVPEEWGGDTIVVDVAAPDGLGRRRAARRDPARRRRRDRRRARRQPEAPGRAVGARVEPRPGPRPGRHRARRGRHAARRRPDRRRPARGARCARCSTSTASRSPRPARRCRSRCSASTTSRSRATSCGSRPTDKVARTVAEARAHRRQRRQPGAPDDARAAVPASKTSSRWCSAARSPRSTSSLKADVQGSLEALTDALRKLDQEHDEVRLSFVHRGVGGITESDVNLAAVVERDRHRLQRASRPQGPRARRAGERRDAPLRGHLQRARRRQRRARSACSSPSSRRSSPARPRCARSSACRASARSPVATCSNGTITRGSKVRFLREGTVIWKGAIASLRRFKDDVREVA